jgi:phage virion morphogenesis protein
VSPDAAVLAMRNIAKSLRQLSRVPAQVAREAADALQTVAEQQFAAEVDPYGRPWAPLKPQTVKRKGGDTRILRRTDRMLDSLQIRPMRGAGISVTFSRAYSAFHQIGTRHMVARKLLPHAGLPDAWQRAIADAAERAFDRWADKAGA